MSSNQKKKRKKKRKFLKYFSISFVVLFSIVAVAYVFALISQKTTPQVDTGDNQQKNDSIANKSKTSLMDAIFGPKQVKINVLVMGTDEQGTRTDVMVVAGYDSQSKKISMISIPRDTKVTVIDEIKAEMKEDNRWMPEVCKLNEVHAYTYRLGEEKRNLSTAMQIEDLLKIKIDYYVLVDLDAFREIVDIVGGVDVDVPRDMRYDDPTQNLHINLKAGMQHLDGEKAEQMVRWRHDNDWVGYAQGDVGRIETQQIFMKALIDKVLSTKILLTKGVEIVNTIYEYVETNVGINDAIKYLGYVKDIDTNNITMATLPGEGVDEFPNGVKTSYFVHDNVETIALIDELFYADTKTAEKNSTSNSLNETISSKDKNIEILNGSAVSGLAGRMQETLESNGFNVKSIGTYKGTRQQQTVIIVKEDGMGEDLKQFFNDCKIEVNKSDLSDGTDIKIITGIGEK